MTYRKIFIFIMILCTAFFLWTCVDVDTTNIPTSVNYTSKVRFVHLATDNPETTPLRVDGITVANLALGYSSPYQFFSAGSRTLEFKGTTQKVVFLTDERHTILIHSLQGGQRFIRLNEGYSFVDYSTYYADPDSVGLRFANATYGQSNLISFFRDSIKGSILAQDLMFGTTTSYKDYPAGSYLFYTVSKGGYRATIDGYQVVPDTVVTLANGKGAFDLTYKEGLSYTIQINAENKYGFYKGATLNLGAKGTNGVVVHSIDVKDQRITFPETRFSGLNQVPPETTIAYAVGNFVLTADSSREEFELLYTINVYADSGDLFTSAHFHNAPRGQNGEIVKTIISGDVFGNTTISGSWKSSDDQPLTPALVDSLLVGSIYINFKSEQNPLGLIRAQIVPDIITVNTFMGTWKDIPDDIRDSIVQGSMYVVFYNDAHPSPSGQIRGQLVVDPVKGHYGIASSIPVTLHKGKRYTITAYGTGRGLGIINLQDGE